MLWLQCCLALSGFCFPPSSFSFISNVRLQMLCQWCTYAMALCTFHLLEFFTTAIYNPSVASSESFLVNHSVPYTAAFLTSLLEFWTRFLLGWQYSYNYNNNIAWHTFLFLALPMILVSQTLRSVAMATAGESFNHIIQTYRHDNHKLVTSGIYRYLRHPSYVGFYYWSVGSQLLLGNWLHATAFCVVSWRFFAIRIPYEEESLCKHFPDEYPSYMKETWIGIPFMPSFQPKESTITTTTSTNNDHTKEE